MTTRRKAPWPQEASSHAPSRVPADCPRRSRMTQPGLVPAARHHAADTPRRIRRLRTPPHPRLVLHAFRLPVLPFVPRLRLPLPTLADTGAVAAVAAAAIVTPIATARPAWAAVEGAVPWTSSALLFGLAAGLVLGLLAGLRLRRGKAAGAKQDVQRGALPHAHAAASGQADASGRANTSTQAVDLDRAREQYHAIFTNAPVGIFRVTPEGRYENVNPEYARIWGCPTTEEMLECVSDIPRQMYANPADRQRFVGALQATGRVDRMELRLKRRDGSLFWGLVSARLVRGPAPAQAAQTGQIAKTGQTAGTGAPNGTYRADAKAGNAPAEVDYIDGFVLDITEQKAMQDQLSEAWRRLRDIIDFLPDAVLVLDASRRVIAWNRAMEEMTGHSASEMLGRGNFEYALPFYGERIPLLGDWFFSPDMPQPSHYTRFSEHGDKLAAEAYVPTLFGGRGAHVWTVASALRDGEGRLNGVIQTIRDITERHNQVRELEKSRQRYDMAISATNDGIWEWELATNTLYHSPRCLEILGRAPDATLSPMAIAAILHPEDRLRVLTEVRRITGEDAERFEHEFRIRHTDGTWRWVLARGAARRGPGGRLNRVAGALADITDHKQGDAIAGILFHIANAINETRDLDELFLSIHTALRRHVQAPNFFIALINEPEDRLDFAYFADERDARYKPVEHISNPTVQSPTLEVIRTGRQVHLHSDDIEARPVFGSRPAAWLGTPLRSRGKVIGAMVVQHYEDSEFFSARDAELMVPVAEQVAVAIERKQGEEMLTHLALHDPLTGLPNRALLLDRIERAIQRRRRNDSYRFAVLMLDLDRFKFINDSHGHTTGDNLLVEVARRMRPVVRAGDTVARLGGDEFALLLEDVDSPRRIVQITRRLLAALERPVRMGAKVVRTSASIGMVLRTQGYDTADALLRDADIAMYQAKAQGKGRFRVFNQSMHRHTMEMMTLEGDLSMAMRRKQLYLEYQPVFAVDGPRLLGFEALVRWRHPTEGAVPPARFIPMAEETGLILRIGQWVLEQAAATLARWRATLPGAHDLYVSVNLSARQASQPNLTGRVARILSDTGLPPEALKLEITETAIMKDPDGALQRLEALRRLGVGIGIDDFGTGYSSLAYLQRFPVDTLKVDRSFVSAVAGDAENREIVRTVVTLGRSLGLHVVAEGVETAEQFAIVAELGCHSVQGYHFSRPVAEERAVEFITAGGVPDASTGTTAPTGSGGPDEPGEPDASAPATTEPR
ncbi:EAL domain-containing protein [Desulfovibrio sp. DS-1]|nr:EAL domain-containing protein [Nitratidesulfovibrio sp. SRB-5]RXF77938.1 EAL domain-containing protein [Desulfovibrio sp. DS-1]